MKIQDIKPFLGSHLELIEALKPENQKIFPFYVFQNFEDYGKFHFKCEGCGEPLSECGNGYYTTAYIVFKSKCDLTLVCSKKCYGERIYDYHEQKYGYPEPIRVPPGTQLSLF